MMRLSRPLWRVDLRATQFVVFAEGLGIIERVCECGDDVADVDRRELGIGAGQRHRTWDLQQRSEPVEKAVVRTEDH